MNGSLFEIASKEKYRYPFKGSITTEELWDLSPEELDVVYKNLRAGEQRKSASEDSLFAEDKTDDATLTRKIEILRHIFTVKKHQADHDALVNFVAAKRKEAEAQIEAKKAAYIAAHGEKGQSK